MALTSGTRLGSYEILSPLGAGGMGEVYKAKDTRLDRAVAIKVLPEHLAESPERKARFEREAKAISQLNHPHICILYDVGEQDGVDFLVMEYIEGETLAERLKKGALPLDEALEYGAQIADGLDNAHQAGIVHRDLKPGNVMLTKSGVKLLDFGLAKVLAGDVGAGTSDAPTRQKDLTQEQAIIGTLQYMAPEQLEGKPADRRSDVFAFGALLYEMLTGSKAFDGENQASLIGAILKDEPPPVSERQVLASALLDRTIEKCLAKDPARRWQTARDLHDALKWVEEGSSQTSESKQAQKVWPVSRSAGIAIVAVALIAGLMVGRSSRVVPESDARMTRFEINLAEPLAVPPLLPAVALSPDGKSLVYVAGRPGSRRLYLRPMDEIEAHPIPETEGATAPFFSTDGRWVGFFTQGKLRKVPLTGGSVVDICDTPGLPLGGSWGPDDTIIFAWGDRGVSEGLRRVSAEGGTPEVLTTNDSEEGETGHFWPTLLPGGQSILFTVRQVSESFGDARIASYSFGTGEKKIIHQGGSFARYSPPDRLVFSRGGTLLALPFDVEGLEATGAPVPILDGVALLRYQGAVQATLSREGSLVYGPAISENAPLVSIDREGNVELLSDPGRPSTPEFAGMEPRLSPDGERLASVMAGEDLAIWISGLERGTFTRLTFGGMDTAPVWTPDGTRITYSSFRDIYWIRADGSNEPEPLLIREGALAGLTPVSWSPDGRVLAFVNSAPSGSDVWMLRLGEAPEPFLDSPYEEISPMFSPDGRWLAYVSDDSGRNEVYVRSFPGPGGKWPISSEGGTEPVWAPDGRELFYRNNEKMMTVPIDTANGFSAGVPVLLFEHRTALSPVNVPEYNVTLDGQRFIMGQGSSFALTRLNVVLNWADELKHLAPTDN